VTQDGPLTTGEHRGQPAPAVIEIRPADGIDPPMHGMQTSCFDSSLYPAALEPDGKEITTAHNPVLAHGQRRQSLLAQTCLSLGRHIDP
jgi:hypothetical protein